MLDTATESPVSVMTDLRLHSTHKPTTKNKGGHYQKQQQQQHGGGQHQQQYHHRYGHGGGGGGQSTTKSKLNSSSSSSSVQVAVRVRPLLPFEQTDNNEACIQVFNTEEDDVIQTGLYKSASSDSTITTLPAWESQTSFSTNNNNNNNSQNNNYGSLISPTTSMCSYQTLQVGEETNHTYTFDHVFPSSTEQIDFYDKCVTPLVESCIEGYNATVLAYGQTGAGKTHTILGECSGTIDDVEGTRSNEGVIPRALRQIFNGLEITKDELIHNLLVREDGGMNRSADMDMSDDDDDDNDDDGKNASKAHHSINQSPFEYTIKIQFLEIYGEDIRDLLDTDTDTNTTTSNTTDHGYNNKGNSSIRRPKRSMDRQSSIMSTNTVQSYRSTTSRRSTMSSKTKSKSNHITLRDGKPGEDAEVEGVHQFKVTNAEEALEHLLRGLSKRVVGKTAMNSQSSRSHAIFTVVVQQTRRKHVSSSSNETVEVEMMSSKIHFVDLSGSERAKRSMTVGKSLKEGIDINKGLLVLGNVISALGSKKNRGGKTQHVPYRDSKLTRLLKGSLGGNHKTLMIACVSPSSSNTIESINTLRYANRAKNIKNKAKINVDPASRVVSELKEQVTALAAELLKVRKKKKGAATARIRARDLRFDDSTDDDGDEFDDCPFSIDFLDSLVQGADSTSLWKKNNIRPPTPRLEPIRPSTEPLLQLPKSNDDSLISDSWEVSERDIKTKVDRSTYLEEAGSRDNDHDHDDAENDTPEDPDVEKNILSYDFTLTKLRESLNDVLDDDSSKKQQIQQHINRRSKSGLGSVRTIDELFDYLQKPQESAELDTERETDGNVNTNTNGNTNTITNTNANINAKVMENQVENVMSQHITKLDETILQNESLLRDMTNSHERYQDLMSELELGLDLELQSIDNQVAVTVKDNEKYENVIDLIEEGSQCLDSMIDYIKGNEGKLDQLEKKRVELKMLTKVAGQNDKEIRNVINSIQIMKNQRAEMGRIMSLYDSETLPKSEDQPKMIDYIPKSEDQPNIVDHTNSFPPKSESRPKIVDYTAPFPRSEDPPKVVDYTETFPINEIQPKQIDYTNYVDPITKRKMRSFLPESTPARYSSLEERNNFQPENKDLFYEGSISSDISHISELKSEILQLTKQLEAKEKIQELRNEILQLKQKLEAKEEEVIIEEEIIEHRDEQEDKVQGIPSVPTTLHLTSTGTDLSALDTSSHNAHGLINLAKLPIVEMHRKTEGHSYEHFVKSPPPLRLKETPLTRLEGSSYEYSLPPHILRREKRTETLLRKAQAELDSISLMRKRQESKSRNADHKDRQIYEYDDLEEEERSQSSLTQELNRGNNTSDNDWQSRIDCEEICLGSNVLVEYVRNLFGKRNNPVD